MKPRHIHTQSGRSMLEMLGVLAIVGVLSVGALAGYSAAMTNYKANQAVDEIKGYILAIKDLYADKKKYDGLNTTILIKADIFPTDALNEYKKTLTVDTATFDGIPEFHLRFDIPSEKVCRKIVTAGWGKTSDNFMFIMAEPPSHSNGYHWEMVYNLTPH